MNGPTTVNGHDKEKQMKVLVTGSSQGIGKAIAEGFVRSGHEVTVHCRDLEKAEKVRAELGAAHAVAADLAVLEDVQSLFSKTGPVDCLILNASVQYKESWESITLENMDAQLNVNIKSTLLLMQSYYPSMKAQGFGRIVTVGSVNQHRRHPMLPMYAATKCAVMSLVENAAKFAAPYGVTINNVSPGAIATPRNADVYNDEEQRRAVEDVIPMHRFGTPEDCVGTILMLCSEAGAYITGDDILIDGGMRL